MAARPLRVAFGWLVDFFVPPLCAACGGAQSSWPKSPVCEACWAAFLPDTSGDVLPVPGRTYAFSKFRARYLFSEGLQKTLHALKYGKMPSIAERMGEEMAACLCLDYLEGMDVLVPVPLHHTRMRERGYNQSELLVKELGKRTTLPWEKKALKRIRATGTQTALDKEARARNLENAFVGTNSVAGKGVLLVDDVCTTGATANECAIALLKAGAVEVRVLAAARV